MAAVAFYHLTVSTASAALPKLVAKTLAADKRALICCDDKSMAGLSQDLWGYEAVSFIPHGLHGKDDADATICPVWIAPSVEDNANDAGFIFFLDGVAPAINDKAERAFVLFDGRDDSAITKAREQWKDLRENGHDLSYWTQDNQGAWSKTA